MDWNCVRTKWRAAPISSTVTTHGCASSFFVIFTLAAFPDSEADNQLTRSSDAFESNPVVAKRMIHFIYQWLLDYFDIFLAAYHRRSSLLRDSVLVAFPSRLMSAASCRILAIAREPAHRRVRSRTTLQCCVSSWIRNRATFRPALG